MVGLKRYNEYIFENISDKIYAEEIFDVIKGIIPKTELKTIRSGRKIIDWEILCDPRQFIKAERVSFSPNNFSNGIDVLKKIIRGLKKLGAKDIKIGSVEMDEEGTIWSDTLYFDNISRSDLYPEDSINYDNEEYYDDDYTEFDYPWPSSPDILECVSSIKKNKYKNIDPYGEEEWNDDKLKWKAIWNSDLNYESW